MQLKFLDPEPPPAEANAEILHLIQDWLKSNTKAQVNATITLPPPPPPVYRVIVPWVPFNILRASNHSPQPHKFVRDIPQRGAWLVVTDTGWRNARYKVTIDRQFSGETSDFPTDSAYCKGGDDCLKVQSHLKCQFWDIC